MFNREIFNAALTAYKRDFAEFHWENEQYKWQAVKCFQERWDVQAKNFPEMLRRAFDKTHNLLASMNNFPREMLIQFATAAPDTVRAALMYLFDESKDLIERIEHFKSQADTLLEAYGNGAKQHFQSENAISTYLWLRETETPCEVARDDYSPNLTEEDWLALIRNPAVFTQDSLIILRRMLDIGGEATCIQLAEKYGDSRNYYNSGSSALAQRIAQKTNGPIEAPGEPDSRWLPILYTGHAAAAMASR